MSKDNEFHDDFEHGLAVAESRPEVKQPPMYKVLLLNDDYTPMDFVVEILRKYFNLKEEAATNVMLQVHNDGQGVCGIFTPDIAETKVVQVNEFARENEHPLLCVMEPETDNG